MSRKCEMLMTCKQVDEDYSEAKKYTIRYQPEIFTPLYSDFPGTCDLYSGLQSLGFSFR